MRNRVASVLLCIILTLPLLGFKGEDTSSKVYSDFTSATRYTQGNLGSYKQPPNPSGVGTVSTGMTNWDRRGWSLLAHGYATIVGNSNSALIYQANEATRKYPEGSTVRTDADGKRRLEISKYVMNISGSYAWMNNNVLINRAGMNTSDTTIGASLVDSLLNEPTTTAAKDALQQKVSSSTSSGYMNAVATGRNGSQDHPVVIASPLYRHGKSSFDVPTRAYYTYASWAGTGNTYSAHSRNAVKDMFDIAVTFPIIDELDKFPPTITANISSRDWDNTNASVTLTFKDAESGMKTSVYAWSTSTAVPTSWSNYTGAVSQSGNGTWYLHARGTDKKNNITTERFGPYRVDKTAPGGTISGNPTAWQNSNATLTFNATDSGGSAVKRVRISGGSWVTGSSTTRVASANGNHSFEVEDNAGNTATVTANVTKIDKTDPTPPVITVSRDGWGTTNVTFTVSGGSDALSGIASRQYKIGTGAWTGYSTTRTVSTEGTTTVYGRTVDNAGNISTEVSDKIHIDKTDPSVALSPNGMAGWQDAAIPFTANFSDTGGSGFKNWKVRYETDDVWGAYSAVSTSTSTSNSMTTNGKRRVEYVVTDNAGNSSTFTSKYFYVDTASPTISASIASSDWGNEDIQVALTYGDSGGSGLKTSQYVKSNSATAPTTGWVNYSAPLNHTTDGIHYIHTKATDNAGNVTTKTFGPYRIDKTSGYKVSDSLTGHAYKNGNDYWVKGGGSVKYISTGRDDLSKVMYQYVRLYDGTADIKAQHRWNESADYINNFQTHPSATITGLTRGTANERITWDILTTNEERDFDVMMYLRDYALNNFGYESSGMTLRVDSTAPTAPSITVNPSSWTSGNATVTLSGGTDSRSGIARREYKIGTGAWTTYSAPFTVSTAGTTTVYSRSIDNVGNISGQGSASVYIERVPPVVTASSVDYSYGRVSRQIGLTFTDATSGIATRQYKVTTSTAVPSSWDTYTGAIDLINHGQHYIHYRAVDGAGNVAVGYFGPYKIDKVSPSGTFNPNSQTWTNGNVGVMFTPSDGESGVSSWRYRTKLDSGAYGAWSVVYTTPQTITLSAQGIHQIEAEVTDNVGNIGNVVSGVYQIDKTLPTVTANPSSAVWRNTGISVALSYSDLGGSGLSVRQYALSTSSTVQPTTWTNYTEPVNVNTTGAWYIWYKAVDNAGNITINKVGTYNIDLVNPNVTANMTNRTWDSSDITVTLSYSDSGGSGVKARRYAWSNSTTVPTVWLNYSSAITQSVEGQWYIHTQVEDNAGNITTKYFGVYQSDKTNPTIAFSPMSRGWGNTGLSVSMNPDDGAGSGVQVWRYRTAQNGSSATPTYGAWSAYIVGDTNSSVSLSSQGEWKIQVEVIDNVGNIGLYTSGTYLIDRTYPGVTFSPMTSVWRNTNMNVVIIPTDYSGIGTSGVRNYRYRLSADNGLTYGSYVNVSGGGNTSVPLTAQGEWVIDVDVYDNANNMRNFKSGVHQIDKTLPNGSYTPSSVGWVKTNITTRFTPSDNTGIGGSGVRQYNWVQRLDGVSVDSGTVMGGGSRDFTFTADGIHTLEILVIDNAGNSRQVNSGEFRIDKTAPLGNNTINYDEHTGIYTVIPSGITDSLVKSANVSGMSRWEITFTAKRDNGSTVGTHVVTRNNPYTGNTIVNIHNQFGGSADRIEVTSRIYDVAGNYRELNSRNDVIFVVKTDITRVLTNGVTNAAINVGKTVDVKGGELMRIKIEALGNPDRVVVTGVGRKVLNTDEPLRANWVYGAYGEPLRNFDYVIENPMRVHSIYSESRVLAKDVFIDVYQPAGEYDVTITAYKNNGVMYERKVVHKVYVGVESTVAELRTRLMYKLPGR